MEEQFGLSDLRHLITRSPTHFTPYPTQQTQPDLFSATHLQFDMLAPAVIPPHVTSDFLHHSIPRAMGPTTVDFNGSSGFDSGTARWPRQETLTLLEIRSKLDHKFKEANQKAPLWDELARIMSEEHGYQRSGKKCREKFENLYKYYKKTKEGKAGRQDGKHYRFFRQLEALYTDSSSQHHQRVVLNTHFDENAPHFNTNNVVISPPQPLFSLSSDLVSSSSYDDDDGSTEINRSNEEREVEGKKKRKGKERSWKGKVKDFIDTQMRKIMEKQETWVEKMMNELEKREQERREREEEWKKQESVRIEREHKFWANERAWIEARDMALMKAIEKLTNRDHHIESGDHHWSEPEIIRLIQLRIGMESRFEQRGFSEEVLWEDIAAKMAYFGYERSAIICKGKWDCINKELQDKGNIVQKRKNNKNMITNGNNNYGVASNLNGGGLYMNHQVISGLNHGNNCEINEPRLQLNDGSSSSPSSHNSNINVNVSNVMNDSCLRFFLGDGEHLGWESNYGVKAQQG